MNDIALAVDLGGTNLRMAAVDSGGGILHLARVPTPKDASPHAFMAVLSSLADECRNAAGDDANIVGISAGVPANFTREGVLTHVTNIPWLEGMNLKADLAARFNLPANLENDATAAAIGENWLGAARHVKDSIHLTLGTGVGGGIIFDDKPLRGIDGTAGRLGHICVEPDGQPCGCGSHGCIEQYASATAIVRMARDAGLDVESSHEVYERYVSDSPPARGGMAAASADGVVGAARVFEKMGRYLGITLAGLVNALNPEMIVIGGGASAAWDAFIEPLKTELHYRAFDEPAERVKIVRSELGDNAGLLGNAKTVFLAND